VADVSVFVERFAAAWREPRVDGFAGLFHPDIVLEQPMLPRMVGKEAAVAGFARLLDAFPGIRGEVLGWGGDGDALFINLRLRTGGSRPLEWTVVDRICLEDDLIRERVSYFDALPLLLGTVTRPGLWLGLVREAVRR
jgi:hypothetical protein